VTKASRTAPRHRSREAALQALYAADMAGEPDLARAEASLDALAEHFELPAGARAFAKELVLGVAQHRDEIDRRTAGGSSAWRPWIATCCGSPRTKS
jgi:transcription termination factor NusB